MHTVEADMILTPAMPGVKRRTRFGIFAACLLLFCWQAYEIVREYLEKEIATKVKKNTRKTFFWRDNRFFFSVQVTVSPVDHNHSLVDFAFCLNEMVSMHTPAHISNGFSPSYAIPFDHFRNR